MFIVSFKQHQNERIGLLVDSINLHVDNLLLSQRRNLKGINENFVFSFVFDIFKQASEHEREDIIDVEIEMGLEKLVLVDSMRVFRRFKVLL